MGVGAQASVSLLHYGKDTLKYYMGTILPYTLTNNYSIKCLHQHHMPVQYFAMQDSNLWTGCTRNSIVKITGLFVRYNKTPTAFICATIWKIFKSLISILGLTFGLAKYFHVTLLLWRIIHGCAEIWNLFRVLNRISHE